MGKPLQRRRALVGAPRWGWAAALCWALAAGAQPPDRLMQPRLRNDAGVLSFSGDHLFLVESEISMPVVRAGPLVGYTRLAVSSPFLLLDDTDGAQSVRLERVETVGDFGAGLRLADFLGASLFGRYHTFAIADRPGSASAWGLGAGLGTAALLPEPTLTVAGRLAGGWMFDTQDVEASWFLDARAAVRLFRVRMPFAVHRVAAPFVSLNASASSINSSERFRPFVQAGPSLEWVTPAGNELGLTLRWCENHDNPFAPELDQGLLLGFSIAGSDLGRDPDGAAQAPVLLPAIAGGLEGGSSRHMRFWKIHPYVELLAAQALGRPWTAVVDYEHHQEYGALDSTFYTVSVGVETPVGGGRADRIGGRLGRPARLGIDYLHRSDHALDPGRDTMATERGYLTEDGYLLHLSSRNLFPRLRLESAG